MPTSVTDSPLHRFSDLVVGRLVRRYKRYLCEVELANGEVVTAHCPNPGRMTSSLETDQRVYLADLGPPPVKGRKLRYRWEFAEVGAHTPEASWVLVNTQCANKVAAVLLQSGGALSGKLKLDEQGVVKSEVSPSPLSAHPRPQGTRFDFCHTDLAGRRCWIEVKQVTLKVESDRGVRWAAFPDATSQRGARHLRELTELRRAQGERTVLFYVVGRDDVDAVRPAHEVDPAYAEAFAEAVEAGVECFALTLKITTAGLFLGRWLPVG